jgi:hypothetical protein
MRTFILSFVLTLSMFDGFSWGATGHRATGWVADKYLNKKAKKELDRILHHQSIAMAATWMDDVRSDSTYKFMDDWHWATIQDGETYEQSEKNPHGDVVATLERVIKALKSHKLSSKEEIEYLKILIHLVGDIHQPLHVGGGTDRGGNDVKVTWFRSDSNLHRVWDSEMIDDTKLSYTELAQSLEPQDATQVSLLQKTSVRDWAQESTTYRKEVYDIGNGKLGYSYAYYNFHLVRQQLLKGGIRLAGILNEIYG